MMILANPYEKGKPYVYELVNSLTDKVFYVGKGHGDRMNQHVREAFKPYGITKKHKFIREILSLGGCVISRKVAEFDDEQDALIYEWILVNLIYGRENLMNSKAGGGIITSDSKSPYMPSIAKVSRSYYSYKWNKSKRNNHI